MRPIPQKMREEMARDPYYSRCCLENTVFPCEGEIEWHHELTIAGRQLNEPFAIIPVCHGHHERVSNPLIKERMQWVVLNRATTEQLRSISKAINYIGVKERLNKIYGKYE